MVAPLVAAAGISAGSSLLGGLLGEKSAKDAALADRKFQTNVMKSQIQWKTQDALKAGIHPIYALGAPAYSASPTAVGSGALGNAIAQGGADISRAVLQSGTNDERLRALSLENATLNNDLLRAQIAGKVKENMRSPPFPNGAMNSDAFLPIPDRSGGKLPVRHPNLAQDAENHYGEIGGELFGGTALVSDADASFNNWMINTFGIDPRNYTPFALGERTGRAVRDWIKYNTGPGATYYKQ